MLDGLKAADLTIKLPPELDVLEGHVEAALGTAELVCGGGEQRNVDAVFESRCAAAAGGEARGGRRIEGHRCGWPSEVERGERTCLRIACLDDEEVNVVADERGYNMEGR